VSLPIFVRRRYPREQCPHLSQGDNQARIGPGIGRRLLELVEAKASAQ
jgi:hypothetical protein